jgi:hypothetical protein
MPIAAESYQCGDDLVTIIRLFFWWREHTAVLCYLLDICEHDGVLLVSKIN